MDTYADELERRATAHDMDADTLCARCGHKMRFHLSLGMELRPCDAEYDSSDPNIGWRAVMCSCPEFELTNDIWPEGRDE